MSTDTRTLSRRPRQAPGWGPVRPLILAAGPLLLVLGVRMIIGDNLVLFRSVTQRSCQGQICVERVHSPDLLFQRGNRFVQVVVRDADGTSEPRRLSVDDPFGATTVEVTWPSGGVSLTDGSAVLTWDADTVASLLT
jgi:hypothetical protein